MTAAASPSLPDTPSASGVRALLFPLAIALAVGLDYFDNSAFSFFISDIAGGIGAPPDELIWSSSAYAVAGVLGILQHQWWVERLATATISAPACCRAQPNVRLLVKSN